MTRRTKAASVASTDPTPDPTPATDENTVTPEGTTTPEGDAGAPAQDEQTTPAEGDTQDTPAEGEAENPTPEGEAPADSAQAVIIPPPGTPPVNPDASTIPSAQISVNAFIEETPLLCREARDILARLHKTDRFARDEWTVLAGEYGGTR